MRKILVTGATGFLGSRILDFYSNKYDLCAPTHSEMDITSEDNVFNVFDKYKPDIVVHRSASRLWYIFDFLVGWKTRVLRL